MWQSCSISVEGTSHTLNGKPCQDSSLDYVCSTRHGDFLVLIVADGCGSSLYADTGSQTIAKEASECISYWLTRSSHQPDLLELIKFAFGHANLALRAKARLLHVDISELASTCLCVISSANHFAAAQIGDGIIVAEQNGACGCVFWPREGEYANTTHALTYANWHDYTQTISCVTTTSIESWFLATDGIQSISCHNSDHTPHRAFISPLWTKLRDISPEQLGFYVESLRSFLHSRKMNEATHDDKTIALAVRK